MEEEASRKNCAELRPNCARIARGAYSWSISLMIVASADVMLSRSWKYVAFADASPHDDAAYAMRWWPKPMRIVPTTIAPEAGGANGAAPGEGWGQG